jgi:prepilin-type N-terminal cleavage/methylation domain-containing protein
MNQTRRIRKTGGFTLLEMMLALVLFATASIAMMELLHRSQAGSTDGENLLIATHLAQARLEELRTTSYGSLADQIKTPLSVPYARFSREVDVTERYTDLTEIIVRVYWNVPGEDTETSVELYAYRSNI